MKKLILTGLCLAMVALMSSCDKDEPIELERLKTPAKCMGCKIRVKEQVNININIKK